MSCESVMLISNQKVSTNSSGNENSTLYSTRSNRRKASDFSATKRLEQEQEVRMNNQDVRLPSCDDKNSLSEFITPNFALPHNSEVSSDMGSLMNVDDWFKQRNEVASSLYLDAVMKSDGIDTAYLGDSIECIDSNNFLSSKDSVDMCLVTNICDMNLGLDLPNINQCEKSFVGISESDCTARTILNDYHEQESLLLSLTNGDLLDKESVLVGDTEMVSAKELSITTCLDQSDVTEHANGSVMDSTTNQLYELSDGHIILSKTDHKESEDSNWIDSLEIPSVSQSLGAVMDSNGSKDLKQNWDSLSIQSQRTGASGDLDSEKDFPEFNFLTLQTDSHGINHSDLPPIDLLEETEMVDSEETNLQGLDLEGADNMLSNHMSCIPSKSTDELTMPERRLKLQKSEEQMKRSNTDLKSNSLLRRSFGLSQSKSKSILKRDNIPKPSSSLSAHHGKTKHAKYISKSSKSGMISKRNKSPTGPMAIIAISTDKTKNTTEVVINTSEGKQIYKGKTSEFMNMQNFVAQSNIKNETTAESGIKSTNCDSKCVPARLNPLFIPGSSVEIMHTSDNSNMQVPILTNKSLSNLLDDFMEDDKSGDEQIMEALREVGVTEDNLFRATVESGRKLWVCPISDCGTLYPRLCLLKLHILAHYGRRPYKCDFEGCKWSFYKYFKLKRHKETHENRKDFECPIESCGSTFTTVYNLKTHIKLHTRPAEMVCPVSDCGAKFQTKRKLEVHMKVHDTEYAPYRCNYVTCGKHYYSANALSSHVRSHQYKEEELRCQYCEKMFTKPCRLKFHIRTHTGDKPFSCTFEGCSWAFTSSSKLTRHMYKHTNVRKFTCAINNCGKSFMRSEHLKEHELTHRQARIFPCPIPNCTVRAFHAKSSLYVHLKKHREVAKDKPKPTMICPVESCNRMYTCKSSFKNHISKAHSNTVTADSSHMDYIALLTGDEDDLANLEGLQLTIDIPSHGKAEADQVSTISPSAVLLNANSTFTFQNLLRSSESITVSGTNISEVSELNQSRLGEVCSVEGEQSAKGGNLGSARTRCTLETVMQRRSKKSKEIVESSLIDCQATLSSGTGDSLAGESGLLATNDITHSFLLQDELSVIGNHFLYQDDHLLSVGSGVGEYQVLLLDAEDVEETQQGYAESTINLRDLE